MIIRLPISEENSIVVYTNPVNGGNDHSGDAGDLTDPFTPNPDNPGSEEIKDDTSDLNYKLPEMTFKLSPSIPDGYVSHRSDYPVALVNVTVPSDEVNAVAGWFSNGINSGGTASETLLKRATSAVISTLKNFYSTCDRNGIFTRPFKIGYALRMENGTHCCHGETRLLLPSPQAPLMPITARSMSGNILQTVTEMRLIPAILHVSSGPFTLPESISSKVTHLDFYMTRQADTLTGDEYVSGVSSFNIGEEHLLGWRFNRLAADIIANNTRSDQTFRIIGSVPITTARAGINDLQLPLEKHNLLDWTAFEALKSDEDNNGNSTESSSETDPSNPDIRYRSKRIIIGPLDLGYPEKRKKVRGVTVRGIFYRRQSHLPVPDDSISDISVKLYGSHHRDNWHHIVSSRGAHLRFLRGINYRWWWIEISANASDRIEAVTFQIQ